MSNHKSPGSRTEKYPAYVAIFVLLLVLCQSCFKDLPDKFVIYQNDFEKDDSTHIKIYGDAGLVDSIKTFNHNGSKVFGPFNRQFVFLDIDDLPVHNAIRVEFDLYIHDKWEGDKPNPGYSLPDFWTIVVNGFTIYLSTFSNGTEKQSFPATYVGVPSINPPRANAWKLTPGICSYGDRPDGSAMYKIDYTTVHDGPLHMIMADLIQGPSSHCIKSWSVDNLRITATTYK